MKKHIKPILLSSFCTLLVCLFLFTLYLVLGTGGDVSFSAKLAEVQRLIEQNAVMDFSMEEAENQAFYAYVSALDDDYAYYMSKEEYEAYLNDSAGNKTGIGITIRSTDVIQDGLFITRTIGGSPAETAGLKAGDLIVALNGVSILNRSYDDVYAEMTGEAGTVLQLTVLRDGASLEFSVTREFYHQRSVDSWMLDGNIGFIRIHSFTKDSSQEFEEALNALLEQGVRGWIFDLRYNLGGNLEEVEKIVSFLIPRDELIIMQFKNREEIYYSAGTQKTSRPMVVLMNSQTASASELMASALRDVNGTLLIGEQSYGKGIGQTTYRLSDGSAVKMTTFYYLTKSRTNYHGVGLVPDVTVSLSQEKEPYFYALSPEEDDQLQAALACLLPQLPSVGNE